MTRDMEIEKAFIKHIRTLMKEGPSPLPVGETEIWQAMVKLKQEEAGIWDELARKYGGSDNDS